MGHVLCSASPVPSTQIIFFGGGGEIVSLTGTTKLRPEPDAQRAESRDRWSAAPLLGERGIEPHSMPARGTVWGAL